MSRFLLPAVTLLLGSLALAAALAVPHGSASQAGPSATPAASPAASPVAMDGCAALGPYFQDIAALAGANEGLSLMREVGFSVLALSDAEAEVAAASLDTLVAQIEAIPAPAPAAAWKVAYGGMIAWYRDMAAARDPLALQVLINNDRQLYGNLGRAQLAGQTACGYDTWTAAWEAAFGD
jgi:opacity protein-like surface antigen